MNQYFKAATKRYELPESKIQPISMVDAEIISELIEIVRKVGLEDVKIILSKYKFLKDSDILDSLLQWNIDNSDKPSEELEAEYSEVETKQKLLRLGNDFIISSVIHGIKIDYDELKLIINPTHADRVTSSNPYVNYVVEFRTEEELDETVEQIKKIIGLTFLTIY